MSWKEFIYCRGSQLRVVLVLQRTAANDSVSEGVSAAKWNRVTEIYPW